MVTHRVKSATPINTVTQIHENLTASNTKSQLSNLNEATTNSSGISDEARPSTHNTLIVGDYSIIKHFDQWRLSKYKSKVRVLFYSGCTIKRLGKILKNS